MRQITIAVLFVLAASAGTRAEKSANTSDEYIRFNGKDYYLASNLETPISTCKQYVPKGHVPERSESTLVIYHFSELIDPFEFGKQLSQQVRQQNPNSKPTITFDKRTGAMLVDFVNRPNDHSFVEFSVYRFEKSRTQGNVAYQYCLREYEHHEEFVTKLPTLRKDALQAVAEANFRAHTVAHRTNSYDSAGRSRSRR